MKSSLSNATNQNGKKQNDALHLISVICSETLPITSTLEIPGKIKIVQKKQHTNSLFENKFKSIKGSKFNRAGQIHNKDCILWPITDFLLESNAL